MSVVYRCDRCGKEDRWLPEVIVPSEKDRLVAAEYYHICVECWREFKDFLHRKG